MDFSFPNDTNDFLYSSINFYAAIAAIPLSVCGLSTNIFLLILFVTDQFFRKTTYHIMLMSVISDIISTITSISAYIQIAKGHLDDNMGLFMCQSLVFTTMTSYSISMMNLCLISIDRYISIVRPLWPFYRIYKKRLLMASEVIIVLISILINFPTLALIRIHKTETIMCEFAKITPLSSFYYIAFAVILYIIPSLVIGANYWRIVTYLKNYVPPGHTLRQQDAERQNKRKKIIKMLISITLCYILFTWPYFVTLLGIAITKVTFFKLRLDSTVYYLLVFFHFASQIA